jgi:hypothetical protein
MNNWYVYYDEDNYILSVTNELKEFGNYYECPEELVIDFLRGTKHCRTHKITVKNYKEIVIEEILAESSSPIFKDIFVIESKTTEKSLVISIIHDSTNKLWRFRLGEEFKSVFLNNQFYKNFRFFICNSEDYNLLYRKIDIKLNSLAENELEFPFINSIEEDIARISVVTKKYVDQIGIIHV